MIGGGGENMSLRKTYELTSIGGLDPSGTCELGQWRVAIWLETPLLFR
jgi:hypothetical protein